MPQYTVGHRDRIVAARAELEKEVFEVKLAGASYKGVGFLIALIREKPQ